MVPQRGVVVLCALFCLSSALGDDLSPLEKWLSEQVITVPDTPFDSGGFAGIEGALTNLACTGLVLGQSASKFSSNNPTELTVELVVTEFHCHSDWTYQEKLPPHIPRGSGDVNITIGASKIGPVTVKVVEDKSTGLPTNVTIAQCDTSITISDFHFSSGVTGAFLNFIKPFILSTLDAQFDKQVCDALPAQTAAIDNALAKADAVAKPLLKPVPPVPPPTVPVDIAQRLVNWNDNVAVTLADSLFEGMGANNSAMLNRFVDLITDDTGHLTRSFTNVSYTLPVAVLGANVTLSLDSLSASGLNSFAAFDILDPVGNFSLSTALSMANLNLSATVSMLVHGDDVTDTTQATFNMRLGDTVLNTTALVGVFADHVDNATLGQLALQVPCVLDTLFAANITHLVAWSALEALWLSDVSGDLATKVEGVVNGVAQLVSEGFGEVLMEVGRGFVGGEGRRIVNEALSILIFSHPACEPYTPPASRDQDLVNFETSELVSMMSTLVNDDLGAEGVNNFLAFATLSLYGQAGLVQSDASLSLDVVGGVVNITGVNATNVNSVQQLDVLVPLSDYVVRNSLAMGGQALDSALALSSSSSASSAAAPSTAVAAHRAVNMSMGLSVDLLQSKDVPPMAGAVNVGMGMTELIANANVLAQFNQTKLFEMKVQDMTNTDCVLSTLHKAELSDMDVSVHNLSLALRNGTSAVFQTLAKAVDSLNGLLPPSMQLPTGTTTLINEQVQTILKDADARCRGDTPNPASDNSFPTVTVAASVSAGVVVLALAGFVVRRKYRGDNDQPGSMWDMDKEGRRSLLELDAPTPNKISLLGAAEQRYSGNTMLVLKYAFPVFMFATLVLKIVALCSLVSRIKLTLYARDDSGNTELTHLYLIDFTFGNMVRYFWNSKAYIITLLIVGGVCILPICKCMLMFGLWFKPAKERTRRVLLGLLDQAGRLALIDAFFLAEIVILFRIDIEQEGLLATLRAEPDFAVLGGIASTIGFSICSHLMLVLHFKCCKVAPPSTSQGVCASTFVPLLTMVVTGVCNALAVYYRLSVFTTGGAAGVAQGKDHATTNFDYYTLQLEMPNSVAEEHYASTWYVSVVMILLTMVAPILTAALVVLSVLVPKRHKPAVLVCLWFASSWCGLDVLLWAFIAGTLEMEMIAQWIFSNKYGPICDALPKVADMECVTIDTTFEEGFWWLLAATLLMFVVVFNVGKAWEHRNDSSSEGGNNHRHNDDEADPMGHSVRMMQDDEADNLQT